MRQKRKKKSVLEAAILKVACEITGEIARANRALADACELINFDLFVVVYNFILFAAVLFTVFYPAALPYLFRWSLLRCPTAHYLFQHESLRQFVMSRAAV